MRLINLMKFCKFLLLALVFVLVITTPSSVLAEDSTPLQGYRIVVDPGHGGRTDPGVIGINGLKEKELVLDVSFRLRDMIEELGGDVLMTRESDIEVPLWSRTVQAVNYGADLFISVHANGSYNRNANGIETYYSRFKPRGDYYLAESLQRSMVNNLGRKDNGIHHGNFWVLNNAPMTAALVEIAYVSNRHEEYLLSTNWYRETAAKAVTEGIVNYVK